jgi:hypothetical protein
MWGFAVTGAIGVLVALAVLPVELRHRRAAADERAAADRLEDAPVLTDRAAGPDPLGPAVTASTR